MFNLSLLRKGMEHFSYLLFDS